MDLDMSMVTYRPGEARTSSLASPQIKRRQLINFVLIALVVAHVALLTTLVLYQESDMPMKLIAFVHYYPMAGVIVLCFAYIYYKLSTYVSKQSQQLKSMEAKALKTLKFKTLLLFMLICQREVVEIVSYTIFPFKESKLPNPLASNTLFSAMNYPSIMLYLVAYIWSIRMILDGTTRPDKDH
jgi:hypothetical protein